MARRQVEMMAVARAAEEASLLETGARLGARPLRQWRDKMNSLGTAPRIQGGLYIYRTGSVHYSRAGKLSVHGWGT